jgi:hypothetical protein
MIEPSIPWIVFEKIPIVITAMCPILEYAITVFISICRSVVNEA